MPLFEHKNADFVLEMPENVAPGAQCPAALARKTRNATLRPTNKERRIASLDGLYR